MNELSLFSGAGGGLLGTKLLGFKYIGYVEYNDYCQRVIRQRIIDGILDEAPIFGDIRAFISEGYAKSYQGMVDILSAGFPCQPFSVAGKQEGAADDRNMWPETIAAIRIIRPRFALLENVPGLLAHEYGRTIFRDLAESGYIPRWRILSAAEMGAPHKRDRLFIVADTSGGRCSKSGEREIQQQGRTEVVSSSVITNAESQSGNGRNHHRKNSQCKVLKSGNSRGAANVANTNSIGRNGGGTIKSKTGRNEFKDGGKTMADTESKRPQRICDSGKSSGKSSGKQQRCRPPGGINQAGSWWATEPGMGRVAHGVANRVDRLKAIGNGQVPAVVKTAWQILTS